MKNRKKRTIIVDKKRKPVVPVRRLVEQALYAFGALSRKEVSEENNEAANCKHCVDSDQRSRAPSLEMMCDKNPDAD